MKYKFPIGLKFPKHNKNYLSNTNESRVVSCDFNYTFGLFAEESGFITSKHIETCMKIITKNIKKGLLTKKKLGVENLVSTIYFHVPLTRKPTGIRMGKGKGKVEIWGFFVKRNRLIFKVSRFIHEHCVLNAFEQIKYRLPIKCRIVVSKRLLFYKS